MDQSEALPDDVFVDYIIGMFGQAANLIFACASTQAGYEEAIRLLKEKYENVDLVREAYIDWVHTFKITNVGKN